MTDKNEKQCTNCGAPVPDPTAAELCPSCGQTYWKCGDCGFLLTAASPPNTCPSCHKDCEFKNVTCYTPECGGPGNIDPRL
jgi:rubrerythrin